MIKRVLICGSRTWGEGPTGFTDTLLFTTALDKWIAKHGIPQVLIEGCARGADNMAGHWWAPGQPMIGVEHYPADWDRYGKSAGPIRNQQMLDEGKPDAVIAFTHDLSTSRGTADMVRRSLKAGLPVWIPVPQPQKELF